MRPGLALMLAMLLAGCTSSLGVSTPPVPSEAPPSESSTASPVATGEPTASPAPAESPTPEPTPDPAALDLRVTSCNGGVVLEWSPSRHSDFHHYIALRSPEREISPQYPPIAPAVDWGDLYATDPFVTSGFDASIVPSATTWHYRVMAYDVRGRVLSQSPVESGRLHPVHDLGSLEATTLDDGRTQLSWRPFQGLPQCFSSYRVLYGTGGVATTLLSTISDRTRTELQTGALHPGLTYTLRVQAVRTTTLGHFVTGEMEPMTYLVPAE